MTAEKEYAKALFSLSVELNTVEEDYSDLKDCSLAVSAQKDYTRIIDSPAIPKAERLGLIDSAFSKVSEPVRNLMKILCERGRFSMLEELFEAYEALYLEYRGICRAVAVTAAPLGNDQMKRIKEKLSRITGKTITLENEIDPSVIGGIMLRYGGIQLDGSVKARLDEIERRLKSTVL